MDRLRARISAHDVQYSNVVAFIRRKRHLQVSDLDAILHELRLDLVGDSPQERVSIEGLARLETRGGVEPAEQGFAFGIDLIIDIRRLAEIHLAGEKALVPRCG